MPRAVVSKRYICKREYAAENRTNSPSVGYQLHRGRNMQAPKRGATRECRGWEPTVFDMVRQGRKEPTSSAVLVATAKVL